MGISLILCLLFVVGSWSCSLRPGIPFYSITQRTILAPLVIHGTVLNISTPNRFNVFYDACVKVIQVIKGRKSLPDIVCFGKFGADYLCMTNVYDAVDYIFFLDKVLKARYDGFPQAAVPANRQTLDMAKRGVCDPYAVKPPSCERPRIKLGLKSIIRVKESQSLIIPCVARRGTKPAVVTWSKRGSYAFPPTSGNSLQLIQVTASDMGTYVCTINNPAGQVSEFVRVFVDRKRCGAVVALKMNHNTTIKSPKYPQSYPGDKECSWRICPSPGQRIGLDFKVFNLLPSDSVQISNECDPNGGGRLKYCSNTSPGKMVSRCTSSCIQLWLISSSKRNYAATGFVAEVSSTDEGSTIYDYRKLYCDNPILIRFLPERVYSSEATGKVLFSYKQTGRPLKGKKITISMSSSSRVDLFGCYNSMKVNMEHYVGASRSPSGGYVMRFFMLTDSRKKPPIFDKHFNDYKVAPPSCHHTAPPGGVTESHQR